LNLPGNFNYRYCRNGQCGYADDIQTPGLYGQGRPVEIGSEPQTLQDSVSAWVNWPAVPTAIEVPQSAVNGRGPSYWAGVEYLAAYHPSWKALNPQSMDKVQATGSNMLVLDPTWTFGRSAPGNNPPTFEQTPGKDALWFDLISAIQEGQSRGFKMALKPTPRFLVPEDEWWESAPRDYGWWLVWFDQYRAFALHHADLAAQTGSTALILGGAWLAPALPGGKLADGTPSGVPEDAELRWRNLLAEVRSHYGGNLVWALPQYSVPHPPPFLDAVDLVYLMVTFDPGAGAYAGLGTDVDTWLTNVVWPFQILTGKPVALAVTYPSTPDLQGQFDAYNALLTAVNQRSWISGFMARGFFPPVALQDQTPSVNGKPTSDLLNYWYPLLTGAATP
jgi:hypothetical protein